MKIENCTQYAFGQDPSGKSVLWAAGKSGWFEVVPSPRYTPIYEEISKAIDLIYFLSDTHERFATARPIRGAKVEEILGLYQQHTDYEVDSNAEAEAVLAKYHSFLIRQMLGGWEGINWGRTYLWNYLSRLFPDEVTSECGLNVQETDSTEVDEMTETEDLRKVKLSCGEESGQSRPREWVDIISKELMLAKRSGHMCKRFCNVDELAKILVDRYDVASKDEAGKFIKATAAETLSQLDADPSQGPNRTWNTKFVYRQLQKLVEDAQDSPEDESKDAFVTPSKAPPKRRHRKSILRPSTCARKGRKESAESEDASEELDDEETSSEVPKPGPITTVLGRKKRSGHAPSDVLDVKAQVASPGATVDAQQEQLRLIRTESLANGRLNVNHLEALVGSLVGVM